jgi:hypothetical protein
MSDFRDPFAAATWLLVPGRTVLVNIDLQNDFLHPDGQCDTGSASRAGASAECGG